MFFINCFSIVFVFFSHLSWSLCIFCHHIHLISCSPWRYMASSKPLHLRGEDKDKGYVPAAAGAVVFWSNDSAGGKLMSSEVKATNVAKWCLMIFVCHALTDADPSSTFHGERLDGLENQLVIRKPGDLQAEFSAKHLAAEWSESKWT